MESRDHKNGAKPKSHTSRKTKYQIYMENIKKIMAVVGIIAIAAVLLGSVASPSGNDENEKFLTMRVIEVQGAFLGSFIVIVDENGKQETIELDRLATKKEPFINNVTKINNTLNSISDKGYKLVSQSGGNDQYCLTTIYTFVKK